jgi:hypothetical protein
MSSRYVLLGLLVLVLFCCEKEGISESSKERLFIKEIAYSPNTKFVFEYEHERPVQFIRFDFGKVTSNSQFYYLGDDLVRIETDDGEGNHVTVEVMYGSNHQRLKDIETTALPGGTIIYTRTRTFTYVNDTLVSYNFSNGYDSTDLVLEWNDGNVTKMDYYEVGDFGRKFIGSQITTFDNKKNFLGPDMAFAYVNVGLAINHLVVSKNNITLSMQTFNGTLANRNEYVYEYNSSNYPVQWMQMSNKVRLTYE